MAIMRRQMVQGQTDTIIVDCGDNAAVSTDVQERIILNAGENVSSATVTIDSKPTGATDPTLGACVVISTNTECNDRIVGANEGFSFSIVLGASQTLGLYTICAVVTTSANRVIPLPPIKIDVNAC